MVEKESPYKKYLREERLPHIFCPGCGNGTVMSTFFKGLEGTDIDFENVAMVSGNVNTKATTLSKGGRQLISNGKVNTQNEMPIIFISILMA